LAKTGNFVTSHSLGTVIAYRALLDFEGKVDYFITMGSPLGLDLFNMAGGIKKPPCVKRWINLADRLDPVAFDADLSDECSDIENISSVGLNRLSPRHPHSVFGYLLALNRVIFSFVS